MNNRIKFIFEDKIYFEALLDNISILNRFVHLRIPESNMKAVYPKWKIYRILDLENMSEEISLLDFANMKKIRKIEIQLENEADCRKVQGLAKLF